MHVPTKVCLPACTTHINGNLYSLLDEECHLLDLKLALQLSTDAELTTASYEEYATAVRELTAYKEQLGVTRTLQSDGFDQLFGNNCEREQSSSF